MKSISRVLGDDMVQNLARQQSRNIQAGERDPSVGMLASLLRRIDSELMTQMTFYIKHETDNHINFVSLAPFVEDWGSPQPCRPVFELKGNFITYHFFEPPTTLQKVIRQIDHVAFDYPDDGVLQDIEKDFATFVLSKV